MAAPTSTNEVTARKFSSSISALWTKIKSTFQTLGNLATAWGSTPSDTKYPSEKLVKTSLDAKGPNVPSEVTIATGDKPLIADSSDGNKVKRANITFDTGVPTTYLCRNGVFNAVKEADVVWGGSFRAELSPAEFGNMARNLVHNPITTAITFEITTDGGTTWTLYERTDPVIRALCNLAGSGAGSQFGLTNALYSGVTDPTTIKGRLTIYAISSPSIEETENTWFYGIVKRILVKISRSGDARMKVEYQTWPHFIGDKVWDDVGTFTVMGDSGWNSIPFDLSIGGYSGQLSGGRIIALRFTYWIESGTAPRISVLNIGFLPQIHWKSNAGNIPLLGVPITIHDNGTGRIEYANRFYTARKLAVSLSNTSTDTSFDGSADVTNIKTTGTLAPGNGGTGKTSLKAAEYNLTTGKSEISDATSGNDRVVFELASPSESNGVTRGFRKLSTIWTWIKGLLSSESGVNISGNAATATKATQDSDGNAINATYFKSSGNTTLVAGAATKIGTQNGADVKLTLPAHQDISGKMNTSASNATAPSSSGGDGATATLLNNLTDGNSDIVTTDAGDNVLIATTDNGGTVTNKWYKRKLVKLIPWIIKKLGTRLVYDCGAGSTSGDDFDAALAAFNAGQWVIIHDSANVYYCAGTYNSGLRFKQIANDASLLKVNTLSWTRGSSPSVGTQIEASLSGHTHTRSDITNFAHTHGNITNAGGITASGVTIANGDSLVIVDSSETNKLVAKTSVTFDGSTTTKALTQKGTFETFMTPSAGNAASGALQNLTGQLSEGTSDFTDNTEIFTSYAGNSGFAESGHVNQPYRRKASSMLNYVRDGFAIDRSPANVGTTHKRISLGYGKYSSSNYVGAMTYIVRLFFNYADDGGLQGKGITVLVTYDFRRSGTQKSECRILSDNGVRDAGYNVVLANYVSGSGDNGKLYICIGLVKNSAPTTLVEFNYSYCKIFRVSTIGDWVQDISSDAVGTYNYIVQATDLVSNAVNADMVDGKHIVIGSWAGASNTIYFG